MKINKKKFKALKKNFDKWKLDNLLKEKNDQE
jgi:hypothetical protein